MADPQSAPLGVRAACLLFLAAFDRFMEKQDLYPADLAEARNFLVGVLDAN